MDMKKRSSHTPVLKKSSVATKHAPEKNKENLQSEPSSPVCYVGHDNFREGFDDLKNK